MKYLVLLFFTLPISQVYAGNTAVVTASGVAGAAAVGYLATATGSATTGVKFMNQFCGNTFGGEAMCAVGAGLVTAAVANAIDSDKSQNIANGLTPGSPGSTTPAYNAIQPQVAAAQQIAAAQGTTLPALAAQAPNGGAGAPGGGAGGAGVAGELAGAAGESGSASDVAGTKSGFKVSSVATDGGGGGGGRGPASAGTGPDLNGLLAGLNGRQPSSGLQKSLNGEPIGVASDNIFTKITQAYQAKTTAQTFLPTGN